MTRTLAAYAATFAAFAVLDSLWLGVVARGWYRDAMSHLMAATPNWVAAGAFYLLYPAGLVIFAVLPSGGDWTKAMALGGLFGLFAYGTYNLTNLAVLRDWPLGLTALDMAWGAGLSAAAATAGALALRWMME